MATLLIVLVGCLSAAIGQNQVVQSGASSNDVHESYRLRVENALYGRVEASLDGGKSYILIGRVLRPATAAAPDKTATQPGALLRGSSEGMAFAVSVGLALKIRPESGSAASEKGMRFPPLPTSAAAEIVTSVNSDKGLFGKMLPPAGSKVMFQAPSHSPGPFPEGYSVSQTDSFVVIAGSFLLPLLSAHPPKRRRTVRWRFSTLCGLCSKAFRPGIVKGPYSGPLPISARLLPARSPFAQVFHRTSRTQLRQLPTLLMTVITLCARALRRRTCLHGIPQP